MQQENLLFIKDSSLKEAVLGGYLVSDFVKICHY